MKVLDIALKDLTRSFRSWFAVVFMFVIPLLVTGMFYFMFGNIAENGDFSLPRTKVIVADMDEGGPKFQVNPKNIPGGKEADTMGELIVNILQSDEMADLVEVSFAPDPGAARAAVDSQQAQVAIVIPENFSKEFADVYGEAVIEFYQDPTLTIGPDIIRAIMNRFMDGMSGVKIAVKVFLEDAHPEEQMLTAQLVQEYLDVSLAEADDIEAELLDVHLPSSAQENAEEKNENILLSIISPIMGGMMIFYAFFTGASSAQSILKEDEEHTLPRLFTTPTSQATILSGKFLAVFMTAAVQVTVLLLVAHLIFRIYWGDLLSVILMASGIVLSASTFGIFLNSFLKSTKQGSALYGGVLATTGMLGVISVFFAGSSTADKLSNSVSLLVPQGWAVRGLMGSMNGEPVSTLLVNTLVLLVWSLTFFLIGVWRFNKRYA
ncbi:MAG: ABC transporter permease [Chloroflexota bacterium]